MAKTAKWPKEPMKRIIKRILASAILALGGVGFVGVVAAPASGQTIINFDDSSNHFNGYVSCLVKDDVLWIGGNGNQGYKKDNIAAGPIGNWFTFLNGAEGVAKTSTGNIFKVSQAGITKFGSAGAVSCGVAYPSGLAMIEWKGKLFSFTTDNFSPAAVILDYYDGQPISTFPMPITAYSADFLWGLGTTHGLQVLIADKNASTAYQINLGHDLANPQWNVVQVFLTPGAVPTELHYEDGRAYMTDENMVASGPMTLASGACAPDCDESGQLSIDDFICFQTLFALGDPAADCDGDESLTIDDFICFQTAFAVGC